MNAEPAGTVVEDELDFLAGLVPLGGKHVVELGCGRAELSRRLTERFGDTNVTAFEVDERQHAANLEGVADPRLRFVLAGAQDLPLPDASADVAIMLKSLHHVPADLLDRALAEAARVLRPGGYLYVSEPMYAGALNDIIKIFNDERVVRDLAYAAVKRAAASAAWRELAEEIIVMPTRFRDLDDFLRKMVFVTFADRQFTQAMRAEVERKLATHMGADGAHFTRPQRINVLQRTA